MQGFAPADEVLLFRQKDPKPFPPVRGPTENDQNVRQQGRRHFGERSVRVSTLARQRAENAADGRFDHSLPGPSASAPNMMARELAPLKQPSPKSRFGTPAPPHPTREPHFSKKKFKTSTLDQRTHHKKQIPPQNSSATVTFKPAMFILREHFSHNKDEDDQLIEAKLRKHNSNLPK